MEQPFISKDTLVVASSERTIIVPRPQAVTFMSNSICTSKYNPLTFVPKNIWEQFHKLANAYFLIIAVLQSIPEISVSGGIPSILMPLCFVLSITALKDALEDLKRRKSDNEENSRKALVRKNGDWVKTMWKDINVGDLVKIEKNQFFPADIVLFASCESNGICYVETKNLDGETNLKHKLADSSMQSHFSILQNCDHFSANIQCETPNPMIYRFNGVISINSDSPIPLTYEQCLLRGSSLKNTAWIIGLVVYTGHETKIMLNSSSSRVKYSKLETQMNRQIFYVFIMQTVLCGVCAAYYATWYFETEEDTNQYLRLDFRLDNTIVQFIVSLLSWMLIFSNFVPISLMVTLEMVKFLQAVFIHWDLFMYFEETDTPARVQTSNLNEELGQIKYVFSDKTGTLTCNVMEFRKFSLGGVTYGTDHRVEKHTKMSNVDFVDGNFNPKDPLSIEFLMHLAICHTIVTEETESGDIEYKASSPDELALVNAGAYFGVKFLGRDNKNNILVDRMGEVLTIKVLAVAEFSSARKRMSIIVEMPDGSIKMFCKGADSILLPRLSRTDDIEPTWDHLEQYASEGLRTLVLAYKNLSHREYETWSTDYMSAMNDIMNRDEKVEKVYENIEHDLILLGATAIEDKLQEGVPETIASLREAGVRVWVLTGDKIETAINIGYSCSLLTNDMGRLLIDGNNREMVAQQLEDSLLSIGNKEYSKYALIVAGDSLIRATSEDNVKQFIEATGKCDVVLACRVSPQQKADIVKLIRNSQPSIRTLSIGDGANDVNMILAAHVGIGISGLEGQQAVRASDYSIAQFKYLKRLMFVHGRECYRKNATLVCYNFYKNILVVSPLFFYGIYSSFSGQSFYNQWLYQLFNMVFCAMPIVSYALFDREIEYSNLMANPGYYSLGLKGKLFGTTVFWLWIFEAFLQGFGMIMVIVNGIGYYTGDTDHGRLNNMYVGSTLVFGMVVILANLKVFTFSYLHTWFTIGINVLSIASYFVIAYIILDVFPIQSFLDNYDGRKSMTQLLENPITYLCLCLLIMAGFMMHPIINHCFDLHMASKLPTKKKVKSKIKKGSSYIINGSETRESVLRQRANSALMIFRRKLYFRYWICI